MSASSPHILFPHSNSHEKQEGKAQDGTDERAPFAGDEFAGFTGINIYLIFLAVLVLLAVITYGVLGITMQMLTVIIVLHEEN